MKELLKKIRSNNILLEVVDGELKVFSGQPDVNPSIIAEIKERKADLVRFLSNNDQTAFQGSYQVEIPIASAAENFPLSPAQRRLWVLSRLDEDSAAYNLWGVHRFEGKLEVASLSYALDRMLERHEILRTVFREDAGGDVRQVVLPAAAAGFRLLEHDLRGAHDEQSVQALIREEILRPFDLAQGPLLRAALFRVTDDQWLFAHTLHHIISDAWSMQVLIGELLELYNSHRAGDTVNLPPLRIQYHDYAVWQQEQLSGGVLEEHRRYWLAQLGGELPVLSLPGDYPRPAVKNYAGGAVLRFIEAPVTGKLQELLRPAGSTLFMGLLALIKTLLYRYTGQEDIITGSSVASREHTDLEGQIGFYVNTLALRTRFEGSGSYLQLLDRVRTVTLEGYAHQQYPFDELVDELDLRRDRSRSVLFDVMVVLQSASGTEALAGRRLNELEVSGYGVEQEISKFDLTFFFTEAADRIRLDLVYNCSIYTKERMELLADHFERLLSAVINHPEVPIASLNYLGTEEQQQLLEVFSTGDQLATDPRSVVELFEAQVMRQPEALALVSTGTQYSYGEANARSNRLSHYLRSCNGTGPGRIVAIMMDRSADLIIALLGVLKSGSAYVVIEPEWPVARKKYILEDTASAVLITESRYLFDVEYYQGTIVALDIELDQLQEDEEDAAEKPAASDLAYVVYTSGTTGSPKGVQIHHHSLTDYVRGLQHRTNLQECRRFGLVSGMSADLGYTVLYGSLLSGGSLHIFNSVEAMDAAALQAAQLDCIKIVPTHWKALQANGVLYAPAKSLIFGGEVLGAEVIEALQQGGASCKVYNHYGPSETTVGKLIKEINLQSKEPITLGRPFCNSRIYILDGRGNLLPVGIPGEICIGGVGVSSGYLNQAALTTEKFIADPWQSGNTLYRTGDIGRWTRNGEVEFLGRKDDQVKIRGYRVELSEIESLLQKHPLIASAAVLLRDTATAEKEVVAYIAAKGEQTDDNNDHQDGLTDIRLRHYLQELLPIYMIPAAYVFVDTMPLKGNGKIDREQLLSLKEAAAKVHEAPRTATEARLLALWQEVLGREGIGIRDNFFDCGGHSLRATRLVSLIHKSFDVQIGLKDVFDRVTIAEQALLIDLSFAAAFRSIVKTADNEEGYPLSSAQRRLWVLGQFEDARIAYNIQSVFEFEGELSLAALEKAFSFMLGRHESLRTVFRENTNGEIRQFILPAEGTGFRIACTDLRNSPGQESEVQERVKNEFLKPFDLTEGPLIRAGLFQVTDNSWVFTYVMHHIISDGWSRSILINELLAAYNAFIEGKEPDLAPLRIQYRDYAIWEQEQLSGEALQQHKDYWLQQFAGELPVLDLPADHNRPDIKTYNGESYTKKIKLPASRAIKMLSQEQGCTLFMGLMAVMKTLFYRYTGQEDIIIGSPVAGRDHIDLENQIGFYVNTLSFRTRFSGTGSYRQLLANIKQVALDAYAHQVYPFDSMVNDLKLKRDRSRHPVFDVQVIVQNEEKINHVQRPDLAKLQVKKYNGAGTLSSVFDMVLNITETSAGLSVNFVYNNDVYSKRSVQQLGEHLEQLLEAILANPDLPLNRLDFLSAADKRQLLEEFNNTAVAFPKGKTMVDLFEEQAARIPEHTAVVFEDTACTYRQLNEKADRLAAYLKDICRHQQGDRIAVMLGRSEMTVIAILGIMKAGCIYVPVDPEFPELRKEFILKDTAAKTLITQANYMLNLEFYQGNIFAMDIQLDTVDPGAEYCRAPLHPTLGAYIIYTSGSTGQPRGVITDHAALANSIQGQQVIFDIKERERTLQLLSASFDSSLFEIFIALHAGAALYIIGDRAKKDPDLLEQFIIDNKIDIATLTPAYLKLYGIEKLFSLKKLIAGGEKANPQDLQAFAVNRTYYNAYGPTESAICASVFRYAGESPLTGKNVPIGKPVPNIRLYIVDNYENLVPAGAVGEIYIGGAGLAMGYLNNPELTANKFIADPFRPGEKVYRTGDLGRWLPDGNLEFTGRKDDQLKLNGYRIEPGEIESALISHEDIDAAVVDVRPDKQGEKQLVAYVVSKRSFSNASLRTYLSTMLPLYMLPSYIIDVPSFPVTANGKTDKAKLPALDGIFSASSAEYIPPATDLEKKMVKIWEEILGKENIGVRNNFFDLGGDSIKILRMTAAFRKELNLDIPISDLYRINTIEEIVLYVLHNKNQIARKNTQQKETGAVVREEIRELKARILLQDDIPYRENIEDIYPMSDVEKGMLYESQIDEARSVYHDQLVQRKILVDFDIDRFKRAVELLADKHAILRTGFNLDDYETEVQIVYKKIALPLSYENIAYLDRDAQESHVSEFLKAERRKPFRFKDAPLWRMNIFNFGNDEIIMALQTHHAIMDGWSDASFRTELHNLYLQLAETPSFIPEKLKSDYRDFVVQHISDKRNEHTRSFWKEELADYTRLDLFTGEDDFNYHYLSLSEEHYSRLEKLSMELNTTVKAISFTAYLFMLKVLNYDGDMVAGLVTNNRPDKEDGDKILGCFLNTIPFRINVPAGGTWVELLDQVQQKLLLLKDYERLNLVEIAQLHNEHLHNSNPFFDMIFSYVDFHTYKSLKEEDTGGRKRELRPMSIMGYGRTNTFFDFTVNVTDGRFLTGLNLSRRLKCGYNAEKVCRLYHKILEHIIKSPQQAISSLEYLDKAEKHQLLLEYNNTTVSYPADKTVTALFEEQVERTPGKTALIYGPAELTYKALNERSNQLAHYLSLHYGITAGDKVLIKLERSEWLIIAILGVLKAGAAYVPVDPAYPAGRIDFMAANSNSRVIIDVAELERFNQEKEQYSILNLEPVAGPDDLAYIMYTSGTTGTPKGVMIEHRSVVRLVKPADYAGITGNEVLLSTGSPSFDATTFEYWGMLLNGGGLVLCSNDLLADDQLLAAEMERCKVDMMWFTAGWLNQLVDRNIALFRGLKTVLAGGDRLSQVHVNMLQQHYPELRIINGYGPTENTTFSLTCTIDDPATVIPIGKPVNNSTACIIDQEGNLLPAGVPGELCVGGDGLARGYLDNPELTAAKFIPDPAREGCRIYKTGDLARYLPDGNIVFLGRLDAQIKIRGYRVEPGETETALQNYPPVDAAVVIARRISSGENELLAYFVSRQQCSVADIRAYLKDSLPDYMIPAYFMQLNELPLTPNGKVDRRKLPAPETDNLDTGNVYAAPENETEARLVVIWQNLLGWEKIGIRDNFFELGGHSLKAMKMFAHIHKEFDVKLKMSDLFRKPTIEEISKHILREKWVGESRETFAGTDVTGQNIIL